LDSDDIEPAVGDVPAYGIHDGATLVECSSELAAIFGYDSPYDMVGKPPLQFLDPDHRDQSIIAVMSEGGGPYKSIGLRADGVRFQIEITAHPVQYQGQIARLILIRDLSPQVLVVDDNTVIRNMLCLLFRKLGYRASGVDSVASALSRFRPGAFALVVTDVVMPHAEGTELASQLRVLDPTLPILMMSGSSEEPPKLDKYFRFIRKPFGLEELSAAIAGMAERARAGLV
jgi:CheY-like chemotaxis protein